MNRRKQRCHETGSSNLLSLFKTLPNKQKQHLQPYNTSQKNIRPASSMGYKIAEHQMSRKSLGTTSSNNIYISKENNQKVVQNNNISNDSPKKLRRAQSRNNWVKQYTRDIQNTKVLYFGTHKYKFRSEQLEFNNQSISDSPVDNSVHGTPRTRRKANQMKAKIKEIQMLLQRKYSNRNKLYHIFKGWDAEHKGKVDAHNVYKMLTMMGVPITTAQAEEFVKIYAGDQKIIISEGKESSPKTINVKKFMQMLFPDAKLQRHKSQMNMKLGEQIGQEAHIALIRKSSEDNTRREQIGIGQILQCLKQKKETVENTLFNLKSRIDLNLFKQLLADFGVTGTTEQSMKAAFYRFSRNAKYASKDLIVEGINRHDHNKILDLVQNKNENNYRVAFNGTANENDIVLKDSSSLNFCDLNRTIQGAEKFKSRIRKYFKNQLAFESIFTKIFDEKKSNRLLLDKKEKDTISCEELKNALIKLSESVGEPIHKRELESFLNMFSYNRKGETYINDLAKIIYFETPEKAHQRLDQHFRGPPPCSNESESRQAPDHPVLVDETQNEDQTKGVNRPFLRKIESAFFLGATRSLELFQKLDTDKDGYISKKELANKLIENKTIGPNEVQDFNRWINQPRLGPERPYLRFQEFCKIITYISFLIKLIFNHMHQY